jgi:hypothetical protein
MPTEFFYYGPDSNYAICPHVLKYRNAAVKIWNHDPSKTAVGTINYNVYLASYSDTGQTPPVIVTVYVGPGNNFTFPDWLLNCQTLLVKQWTIPQSIGAHVPAPAGNPVGSNYTWDAETFEKNQHHTTPLSFSFDSSMLIYGQQYALLATLQCGSTGQAPNQTAAGTDPCVGIFASCYLP